MYLGNQTTETAIQDDLFAPSTNVNTSVRPGVSTLETTQDVPLFGDYAEKVATRIWPKEHTRKHNLRGVSWFMDMYPNLTLADVSRKHIYAFIEDLVEKRNLSPNTGNRYMAALSAVMREANEREIVNNPIKLKYVQVKSGRPRFFTEAEEEELVNYLRDAKHPWMADMVTLSCNTGMRKSEVLAISDPAVELTDDGQWLYLPESLTKEGKDKYVPLNQKALAAYTRLTGKYSILGPRITILHYSHTTFYSVWRRAQRDVFKGDKNCVFHTCRHTAATRLANDAKVNIALIGTILGHASPKTTQRYVHAKKSSLLEAVQAI